jgi:methylenetetrahydrofolate reductase (NADPH)
MKQRMDAGDGWADMDRKPTSPNLRPSACIRVHLRSRPSVDRAARLGHTRWMSFPAAFASGRFAVAVEITPPQHERPKVLLRRAGLLGGCADAINVIQRPERQSSLSASLALRAAGLHPVWHLVNRGRTRVQIVDGLRQAAAGDITQVLCLRGDHAAEDTAETPAIREVITLVRRELPGALIGATLSQYAPDPRAALRNLLPKLSAGAAYVQTQPVFEVEALHPLAEAVRDHAPDTRIVPMVMPLLSVDAATRIAERLHISLPRQLVHALQREGSEAGWRLFEQTIFALVNAPWAGGVALMTYEVDPPPEVGEHMVAVLRAAGVLDSGTARC